MNSKIANAALTALLMAIALNAGAQPGTAKTAAGADTTSAPTTQSCHKGGGAKAHAGSGQHKGTKGAGGGARKAACSPPAQPVV